MRHDVGHGLGSAQVDVLHGLLRDRMLFPAGVEPLGQARQFVQIVANAQ
jgi:hypothetical protein